MTRLREEKKWRWIRLSEEKKRWWIPATEKEEQRQGLGGDKLEKTPAARRSSGGDLILGREKIREVDSGQREEERNRLRREESMIFRGQKEKSMVFGGEEEEKKVNLG